MIKAVIFDADGVTINKPKLFSEILKETYNVPTEEFMAFYKAEFSDLLMGKGDLKEALPKYLKAWNIDKTPDELLQFWFENEHYIDETLIQEVKRLRQQGIKCFLGTNQERYRTDYIIKEMGFGDIFDAVYSSAYLGARKPDPEFFGKLLQHAGLQKDEVIFWDDDKEYIEGGKSFGIQSYIYTNLTDFQETMQNLGL